MYVSECIRDWTVNWVTAILGLIMDCAHWMELRRFIIWIFDVNISEFIPILTERQFGYYSGSSLELPVGFPEVKLTYVCFFSKTGLTFNPCRGYSKVTLIPALIPKKSDFTGFVCNWIFVPGLNFQQMIIKYNSNLIIKWKWLSSDDYQMKVTSVWW